MAAQPSRRSSESKSDCGSRVAGLNCQRWNRSALDVESPIRNTYLPNQKLKEQTTSSIKIAIRSSRRSGVDKRCRLFRCALHVAARTKACAQARTTRTVPPTCPAPLVALASVGRPVWATGAGATRAGGRSAPAILGARAEGRGRTAPQDERCGRSVPRVAREPDKVALR